VPLFAASQVLRSVVAVSNIANRNHKIRARPLCLLVLALSALSAAAQTATPVNVPTWRYDNTHNGENTQETLLTTANVNANGFGKLFSVAVDGYVYAQPLYVSGITMPDGLVHNVIYVATEHDSVYAFDADTNGGTNGQPLWHVSMLDSAHGAAAGATTVPSTDLGTHDIVPEIGITSTPVYDLPSQTLYVVAKSKENGIYIQRIHALNMLTGSEQSNSPSQPIAATVTGSGNGSSGGQLAFSPMWQMNRVALSLFNGYLYIAFGSHGDNGPWHGWVMAYDATTLQQTGTICLSPNGFGNGIWGSGAGLPIDTVSASGRLFLSTGNGSYTSYPPLSSNVDYANSIVRLDLGNGSITPGSAFTPFNQAGLTSGDVDQGSGGNLILPDQPGAHPHELLQVGKEGRILLLDRDNLGGYAPGGTSNTSIVQDIPKQTAGLWSTPSYWNGHVYMWGNGDVLKRFDLANGLLSTTPMDAGTVQSLFPGASPVISANGTQNGIVWAVRTDAYNSNGSAILYAFDANNLASPLYESDANPSRDDAGPATKFAVPVVTNGQVYVAAAYQVDVYGLLNGSQQAQPPVITPNGGAFAGLRQVTMTSSTPNASIYYTTDGTLPTPAATLYAGPLTLSTGTTIRAMVTAQGYLTSSSSATFTFVTQTPAPVLTPAPGSYTSAQIVTMSDTFAEAIIYYTTDGSTPTASSPVYTGPITVNGAETLQAMATSSLTPSVVAGGTYTIQYSGTGINFGSGFSSVAGLTLNGSVVHSDDSRLQLTNGGKQQRGSVFYNAPMNVQSFTNDFSFQLSNAQADGFTFTIQASSLTAMGGVGGGLGYASDTPGSPGGIPSSVSVKFDLYNNQGEGVDSTGLYTNGASPTIPSIDLTSSGINLHSGDTMNVHMTYDGTTLSMMITDAVTGKSFSQSFAINIPQTIGSNSAYVGFTAGTGGQTASQKILTWTFVSSTTIPTQAPVIFPNGGTFTTPQAVSLTDQTNGAVIYYTVDGSMPTTASLVYSGPLIVTSGTVTISTLAVAPGYSPSAMHTATITILPPTAGTPIFAPTSGTYIGPQTVSITGGTPGATTYYTTDGSLPTVNSSVYSSPINVTASEVINAIAASPGFITSQVSSAAYVIQSMGQGINFGAGFTSTSGIALNGSAHLNTAINALELTDGHTYESSTAWATMPVDVSAFTTDFTFQMKNPSADGFTFAIQSNGVSAKGPYGGALAYATIPNSVALKFDIYNNSGEGTNSIGVYTGGAQPTIPATNLTGSGIILTSGDVFHVHLVYNGAALQVSITDTNTSASYSAIFPVDIPGALGTSQGYVGFTGGTGGFTVTTDILNWTLTPVSAQTAADPTFSPAPGMYTNTLQASLVSLTPNATIYYTTDGSQPSHQSAVYSGPIQVNGNSLTVKAFASAMNFNDSPIVTGTYVIQPAPVAQPVISPPGGSYTSSQTVSIAPPVSGAIIYYTTNGSAPTAASKQYTSPFTLISSQTINAIAVVSGAGQSNVATAAYNIQAGGQAINFGAGFSNAQGLTLNGTASNPSDGTLSLTNTAAKGEAGSVFFNTPVDITKFQTSFTFQQLSAVADGFTFTIQSNSPTSRGPSGGGLGYGPDSPTGTGGIPNSVALKFDLYSNAGEGNDSTGLYIGGASPTIPAINLAPSGIVLTKGDVMVANITYDGAALTLTLTDQTTNKTFTQSFTVNIPAAVNANSAYVGFTASTGGYTALQKILNWTYTQTALTQ